MDTVDFNTRDELGKWLDHKPAEWAHIVSTRAALRAFPHLENASTEWLDRFAIVVIHTVVTSWQSLNLRSFHPDPETLATLANATDASASYARRDMPTQLATDAVYLASLVGLSGSVRNAAQCIKSSAEAAANFVYQEPIEELIQHSPQDRHRFAVIRHIWSVVSWDCDWLASEGLPKHAARRLTRQRLWPFGFTKEWMDKWKGLKDKLLAIDHNYAVWIDWYERRIRGERAAFDIPGDKRRVEDKKILRRLAEATDEDFWGKGHEYVNATLKGWIEEARKRVAPPPPESKRTPAQIATALEQQASPQAQIVDGRLDAVPNTIFDKPQYSDSLADLPSVLMAYTSTIISSLPTNCEPLVRNCFKSFHDELLVRGNRPILNILKGMATSLQAELYISADEATSPDHWQMRDPREWGPGMGAMFAHFFKTYLDLINHFPLDKEREDLIANTPIDEVAASGAALTAPVDAVADEIVKAGERGDATDNFVRIIEAMRLYNRDIAQLPPPSQPVSAVTPKHRHVLMTLGFYISTISVLGSAASLYSLPVGTFGSLIDALQKAIDALMRFIP
jgi:hypothetical protein